MSLDEAIRALVAEEVARAEGRLRSELAAREPGSKYATVAEAAELIRARPQRVYDLLSSGRLRRCHDGRRVLIERAESERYVEEGR